MSTTTTLSAMTGTDSTSVHLKAPAKPEPSTKKLLNYGEDGKPAYKVPTFTDKFAERRWAKEQVAGAFRVFGRFGYADGGAGHISLRGPCI